jgi:P4 family phage/plasmid primase-like protien
MEEIYGDPNAYDKFMKENKTNSSNVTHTSINTPKCSYNIDDNKLQQFYIYYIQACFQFKKQLCLTEKVLNTGCLRFDIDFKYNSSSITEHEYNTDLIIDFVKEIHDLLNTYLVINNTKILEAFILERDEPYYDKTKSVTKDGFHILFPNCIVEKKFHLFILDRLKTICSDIKLFDKLTTTNQINDIIDKASVTNNWLIYGSSKTINIKPKLLKYIIDSDLKNIYDEKKIDIPKLVKHLSIRKSTTINDYNPEMKQHIFKESKQSENSDCDSPSHSNININGTLPKHYEDICALIKIISEKRANENNTWMEVGWCLHNIDKRYLPAWISFSKLSSKFKEGECEKLWKKFKTTGLHIGTLYWWAKEDNIEEYRKFLRNKINPLIHTSILNQDLKNCKIVNHYDIAKVIKGLYFDVFKSLDLNTGIVWYCYENHNWKPIGKKNIKLRQKFSNEVYEEYRIVASQLYESETNDSKETESETKKNNEFSVCDLIAKKLKATTFKNEIMTECTEVFCDNDTKFETKLDSNIYLLCFKNGVYDLKSMIFRDGRPDDYISLSTNLIYKEFNPEHPKVKFIFSELKKIIPDDDIREYLLLFFGSCLEGRNKQQKLHIFTGTGSNGKSILIEFLEEVFGELASKMPIQFLCSKRGNSGAASPELARTRGIRLLSMQEPESTAKFNEGQLKELTGADKMITRELFKGCIEFVPQYKPIICCNTVPTINAGDGGTQRRMVIVPFESKFVMDPKEPNEYARDDNINEKLCKCKEHMMALLIHYYKKFQQNGGKLYPPDKITIQTEAYLSDNDIFKEFISTVLEPHAKETVGIMTIFGAYRQWINSCHPEVKLVQKNQLKNYLMQYSPKQYEVKTAKWNFKIIYEKINGDDNTVKNEVNNDDLDGL